MNALGFFDDIPERADNPNLADRDVRFPQALQHLAERLPLRGDPMTAGLLRSDVPLDIAAVERISCCGAEHHEPVVSDLIADVEHRPIAAPVNAKRSADPNVTGTVGGNCAQPRAVLRGPVRYLLYRGAAGH